MRELPLLAGTSLVDVEFAAGEFEAIECLDRLASIVVRHLDETESAGAAGLTIRNDRSPLDGAVLGEQRFQFVTGGGVGKIPPRRCSSGSLFEYPPALHGRALRPLGSRDTIAHRPRSRDAE